ncbi:MAG: hypothetical protein ACRC78_08300 [Planktothrix sp.]
MFEKTQANTLKEIRNIEYKMPNNYISWRKLSSLIALGLWGKRMEYRIFDRLSILHYEMLGDWWRLSAPLYCISEELFESLDNTDAIKEGILAGWEPPIPGFILAIPKGLLNSPYGTITYIVVRIKEILIGRVFMWATLEQGGLETCWFGGTEIEPNGNLSWDENLSLGKDSITELDRAFINRIRNLVVNILLILDNPSELSNESIPESTAGKGFSSNQKSQRQNQINGVILYPRWLDSKPNTKPKTSTSSSTHNPPITHWRRGHWRTLQPGEGKKWKQTKRIWIKPQIINS